MFIGVPYSLPGRLNELAVCSTLVLVSLQKGQVTTLGVALAVGLSED